MTIFRTWRALAASICLMASGAAFAVAAPTTIPVTVTPATGNPGGTVQPVFSLDVAGFDFESFDLKLSFSDPLLTFDLGSSRITVNGTPQAWTALPGYQPGGPTIVGDVATFQVSSIATSPQALTGPLVLRPVFHIRSGAPLGATTVAVSGSMGTHPVAGELDFDSSALVTVSAVPEPEMWLLWLAGAGLVAWKRRAVLRP